MPWVLRAVVIYMAHSSLSSWVNAHFHVNFQLVGFKVYHLAMMYSKISF